VNSSGECRLCGLADARRARSRRSPTKPALLASASEQSK